MPRTSHHRSTRSAYSTLENRCPRSEWYRESCFSSGNGRTISPETQYALTDAGRERANLIAEIEAMGWDD